MRSACIVARQHQLRWGPGRDGVEVSDVAVARGSRNDGGGPPAGELHHASTRRALRILDEVGRAGERITAKRLARDVGTSLSTCYQLLNILLEEGYLEKGSRRGGYRLGPAVALLKEGESGTAASIAEPVIRELCRRAGRTACFAVISDGDVTVTHVENPVKRPPVGVARGLRGAGHALAVGKVLVAGTGIRGISDYLRTHELEAFTRQTITDAAHLHAHLKDVRRTKLATDLEEFAENLFDVAVPVEAPAGTVRGAIGLFTTARRSSSEVGMLVELARSAAREMAAQLD